MSISNLDLLTQLISTAQATYATKLSDFTLEQDLKASGTGADFTEVEASNFVKRFKFIDQFPEQLSADTGFSATLFFDNLNQRYVFAIRGTQTDSDPWNDLAVADLGQIGTRGFAYSQAVAMYRNWKELQTAKGQAVYYSATEVEALYYMKNGSFRDGMSNAQHQLAVDQFKNTVLSSDKGVLDIPLSSNVKVDVTGHSLGGNLAYVFSKMFPQNTNEVVTLNAPGVSSAFLGDLGFNGTAMESPSALSVTSINAEGDSIHSLRAGQLGTIVNISQEVSHGVGAGLSYNHSSINGEDSLQLMSLFAKLDPSQLNQPAGILNNFMRAASNQTLDTFENMLDGLRYTLLGKSEWVDATKQGGKGDIDARNSLYNNMDELTQKIAQGGSF